MMRNYSSQNNVPESCAPQAADPQWEELVLELCKSAGNPSPDRDEMVAAHYLSGDCAGGDREHLEETIRASQDLSETVALAREVLKDMNSAA
jgi:hypothetical protein